MSSRSAVVSREATVGCLTAFGLIALSVGVFAVARVGQENTLPAADPRLTEARLLSKPDDGQSHRAGGASVTRELGSGAAEPVNARTLPAGATTVSGTGGTATTSGNRITGLGQLNLGPGGGNQRGGGNRGNGGNGQLGNGNQNGNGNQFGNGNQSGSGQGGISIAPKIEFKLDASGKLDQHRSEATTDRPTPRGFSTD